MISNTHAFAGQKELSCAEREKFLRENVEQEFTLTHREQDVSFDIASEELIIILGYRHINHLKVTMV